nr:arylsulfatase [Allomuricauda sp.]
MTYKKITRFGGLFMLCVMFLMGCKTSTKNEENVMAVNKPNIVLIMVDDMGWSDIGSYGGEIPTPNIDALAENGIRFKDFYNTARCCPTRASLLTGLYPHQTGIGQMTQTPKGPETFNWKTSGYQGYLNQNCVTIAEVLKADGYNTYMTGKWHLGYHGKEKWPLQRGFDRYYGTLAGASSFFKPHGNRGITIDNEEMVTIDEPHYYTTDKYTDVAIDYLKQNDSAEKPFFLYLAYNAPHWPLQAKEEHIALFKDKYLKGWDELRQERLARQVEMGLIDSTWNLSPRDHRVRPWEKLSTEEQEKVAYRMAVYAAMVYSVDENIGKLVSHLKENGKWENTAIFFLSDNGACAEMYHELGSKPDSLINDPNFGGAVSYGIGWANASNTPFFEYKVKSYEGGIATPFIAHFPKLIEENKGEVVNTVGTIRDIMPTVLELTGASYPKTSHGGETIYDLEGQSLVPTFEEGQQANQEYLFWEHNYFGAVRKGDWKLVYDFKEDTKELFNLKEDRTETNDLSLEQPDLVAELDTKWQEWANSHQVYPKKTGEVDNNPYDETKK